MTSTEEHAADERQPLLERSVSPLNSSTDNSSTSGRKWTPPTVSTASLIIPVAFASRLATGLVTTTTLEIISVVSCRLWYAIHDPEGIPAGPIPIEKCSTPAIEEYFSSAVTLTSVSDGICVLISLGAIGHYSAKYGRKPVLIVLMACGMLGFASVVASSYCSGPLEIVFLVVWLLFCSFAGPYPLILICSIYVSDLATPEERTTTLSVVNGWAALGASPAYMLGGLITTRTGHAVFTFSFSAVISAATMVYIAICVPESFPKAKREELQSTKAASDAPCTSESFPRRILNWILQPLAPLKEVLPQRDPVTQKLNWRLPLLGAHILFADLGDNYAPTALCICLIAQYQYTSEDTGYVLSLLLAASVVALTVCIPVIVRLLRPWYKRASVPQSSEDSSDTVSEASDHLDVHIAVVSWLINITAYFLAIYGGSLASVIVAIILVGLSSGARPSVRSLVVASVEPSRSGEVLSGVEMLAGLGNMLSTIVLGSILTATISTIPELAFWFHAVVVAGAAGLLLFVRDSDRFQRSLD